MGKKVDGYLADAIGPRLKPVDLKLLLPDLISGITGRTRGRLKSSFVERGKPGSREPSPPICWAMPTDVDG